jgi:zinc-ribbon domain
VHRIYLIIILVLLALPNRTSAQSVPGLESLIVDFWPEYDQPGVLVIYQAVLSPVVSLPTEVTFRIPVESGRPHAVAVGPSPELVSDVVATTSVMGEWIEVSFTATTPAVRLEYYDPRLEVDGALRTYLYEWPGDYAVSSFTINVQHPVDASNVRISPTSGQVVQSEDGFTYNVIDIGDTGADERFSINLEYDKDTDALSVEALQVQPSAPITPVDSGLSLNQLIPWALGILGVLLIAGGGLWYWRSGRETPPGRNRRRRKDSQPGPVPDGVDGSIYCHQCGKRAEPGDRFCRSCGTRLRPA